MICNIVAYIQKLLNDSSKHKITGENIKYYLALLAYSMADNGLSLIASVNNLMASSRFPKKKQICILNCTHIMHLTFYNMTKSDFS